MNIDEQLGAILKERAPRVEPNPQAWGRISREPGRDNRWYAAGAAAAVAAVAVGAVAITQPDDGRRTVGTPTTAPSRRSAAGSGCATGTGAATVAEFVAVVGRGIAFDYDPLKSAGDAVERADLIVVGRLVDVTAGIAITYSDPALTARGANTYVTFVVEVDRVLDGSPELVSAGRVYVVMPKSTEVTAQELAALMPRARGAFVLEDVTDWAPDPAATVQRPDSVPGDAPLSSPYTDGIWLQCEGDAQMAGVHAELRELGAGWSGVRTVDQFVAAIDSATR